MKPRGRICVSAACLLLLISLFFGFQKAIFSAIPQSFVFTFDARSSQQFQHDVSDFAQQLDLRLAHDPSTFCDALKKQFPLIASLQTELSASGAFFIAVQMAQPICFINDDMIIAAPGIKGTPYSYDEACLARLPHFACSFEDLQWWPSEKICSFACALSPITIENYSIVLGACPELNLINKEQPRLKLQVRSDLFNEKEIIRRAQAVAALLVERGAFAGKTQRQWLADMRFVKQIILKVN